MRKQNQKHEVMLRSLDFSLLSLPLEALDWFLGLRAKKLVSLTASFPLLLCPPHCPGRDLSRAYVMDGERAHWGSWQSFVTAHSPPLSWVTGSISLSLALEDLL
jgi:hypothetical protein